MQNIPLEDIRRWTKLGECRAPVAISTVCPHCNERVTFAIGGHSNDNARRCVLSHTGCPGCDKHVSFFAVRLEQVPKADVDNPTSVFMHPSAINHFPVPDLPADFPEPLKRSLHSTIQSLNSRNYTATAVGARRTLEGIFKYLIDESKRNAPLVKLIEQATSDVDLADPLTKLAHAIRSGGNLGAHFDMDSEPSEALARQMVELLVYLIAYLYVLPRQITDLETSLGKTV